MRIAELSRAAGVSIPTLKYYLREELLPTGVPTAPNQAEYSEEHVRRLRLIRTLAEIGGLRLRDIRSVLEAIDDPRLSIHELLGVAHHALGPREDAQDAAPANLEAGAQVDRFLERLGWRVSREAPARRTLARALVTLRHMGWEAGPEVFEPYARVAERLAAHEVATVGEEESRAAAVERVVLGTVVFEAALVALRRLAQEHHSEVRFSRGLSARKRGSRR